MSEKNHGKAIAPAEVSGVSTLSPIVAQILAANPTPDVLAKLLDVQRQWDADQARRAYTTALVALKRDLPAVIDRDQTVAFGETRYTHTSLAAVMDAVTEALTQHGFSIAWEPQTGERAVTVTCRLTHADGHSESATISAPPDNSGRKSQAQAIASTITLLSRYTALSLLGIATADMREPHGPRPSEQPSVVDTAKNLAAAAWLKKRGRSLYEAEEMVGRPTAEWTAADLDVLREWGKQPADREPGEEG